MGPDPLWLRVQGQAEAVGGDRTATTSTIWRESRSLCAASLTPAERVWICQQRPEMPMITDHCPFGGRGSPMILEMESAWRDKSEMMTETCRMRALAVSRLGGASLSPLAPPARLG